MANSIIEFFKNQNVFITGGTGFLGRVLVEKLLSSSPDIGNIYLLMRKKKNRDMYERLEHEVNLPLFDILREKNPGSFKKIIPVSGNCMELGLGLSEADRRMLEENVSIVFHCAASVRFDDPLKYAIINNTRATRELMMLARRMKNLKVLLHVSTSYCNCDRSVIEEKMYPAHADWREMIEIAENTDEHTLNILTEKLLGNLPNTYVFTKSLSEHVVEDLGENIPVVIVRPSIVVGLYRDPAPGWNDNFNGPVGLMIGSGKGVVRTIISNTERDSIFDFIPIDTVVKIMCISAWLKANSRNEENPSVYNATSFEKSRLSLSTITNFLVQKVHVMPLRVFLWVPRVFITDNMLIFTLHSIIVQLIPALIIDFLIKLSGRKPILAKIQRKIFIAFNTLSYFTLNSWIFKNDKMVSLQKQVPEDDKPFLLDEIDDIDPLDFMVISIIGVFRYLLNIPTYNVNAMRYLEWMKAAEKIILGTFGAFMLYLIYYKIYLENRLLDI